MGTAIGGHRKQSWRSNKDMTTGYAPNGVLGMLPDVTLTDGDTYVFTIDLTGGCANGVLTITRK